jgi:RHH-type proline utilization regulon transcriptional repressor/proline dehydrogenase/delta 1-pyrroline-5-carboxylate dehydrogenase
LAAVLEIAGGSTDFEFQRLHGMGEALYEQVVGPSKLGVSCRIYAPVGSHEDLLAYLVRRLLENGANSSFVNRIHDEALPIEEMIADPATKLKRYSQMPHPRIPLPEVLYGAERRNSRGIDLNDPRTLAPLAEQMAKAAEKGWQAAPLIGGAAQGRKGRAVLNPADHRQQVGEVVEAGAEEVEKALARAARAAPDWDATPAEQRARCLDGMADLMEQNTAELMALCVREAGKSVPDAIAEVREAVDFCRYYAARARADFGRPQVLPGPTGERNEIALHGRGVFVCISPWNFPLAIFTGQVAAALAAGNAVIAKPAEQTPMIGALAVSLLHRAGVPGDVLHLLPGDGPTVGGPLTADERIAGVAFTGSTEVARLINQTLAKRNGPIVPLIAETGGQNAMIVDSTALPARARASAARPCACCSCRPTWPTRCSR